MNSGKCIATTGLLLSLVTAVSGCSLTTSIEAQLHKASQAEHRSEQHAARDPYRNPSETLSFFGLETDMTVVEIWPGAGWYTEFLAPALKVQGQLYTAHYPSDSKVKYYQRSLSAYKEKLEQNKVYNQVKLTEFYPGSHHDIAPANSVDMVLSFRNLHNWYMQQDEAGVQQALAAFHASLKPGGILGIVEHRLPENKDMQQEKRSGYVKQSWVIKQAQLAGFELLASSEINANPKDKTDHPQGVWTLPPRLALGDRDKQKYLAIGESDRMTLKFIKK